MNKVETINTPIGGYAPDFELPNIDRSVHHLTRYLEKFRSVCVVSLSNECPYVEKYINRLKILQTEFSDQGFILIGITCKNYTNQGNFDPELNFEKMKIFAESNELNFPYLWDTTQDVTHCFGTTTTCTGFLIDHDGVLRYKGQIDDHPEDPSAPGTDYLKNAIANLLAGKEINPTETTQVGTPLEWRK